MEEVLTTKHNSLPEKMCDNLTTWDNIDSILWNAAMVGNCEIDFTLEGAVEIPAELMWWPPSLYFVQFILTNQYQLVTF